MSLAIVVVNLSKKEVPIERIASYKDDLSLRSIRLTTETLECLVRGCVEWDGEEILGVVKTIKLNSYNHKAAVKAGILTGPAAEDEQKWTSLMKDQVLGVKESAFKIMTMEIVEEAFKTYMKVPAKVALKSTSTDSTNILPLIIPFFAMEGFMQAWEQYIQRPDEGCEVMTGEEWKNLVIDVGWAKPEFTQVAKTAAEVNFHILMFCICAAKSFVNVEQFEAVKVARASGLAYTMGSRALKRPEVINSIDSSSYRDLASNLAFLPVMRETIYRHVILYSSKSHLISYLKPLLKSTQMTLFTMISLFVFSETKTKAHFINPMFKEMIDFLQTYKILVDRYGEALWQYAKLLSSTETMTSTVQWPNLVIASFYHNLAFVKHETIMRLKVDKKYCHRIAVAVSTPLKDTYISVPEQAVVGIKDITAEMADKMHIDKALLVKDGLTNAFLEADDSLVDEIHEHFRKLAANKK